MKREITIEIAGRAYNRWVVRVWRKLPDGEFVPQTLVDWGPFWGELRRFADSPLAATLVVTVSPFDPDGNPVAADLGYLLVELTKAQADVLDDSSLLRGQLDIHGRNPAGSPERLVAGIFKQRLGITESSV